MKVNDYLNFKRDFDHAVKHWAVVSEESMKILHGKRKNDNFLHIRSLGRPRKTRFELCLKPHKKCLFHASRKDDFYCMAETPCWKGKP